MADDDIVNRLRDCTCIPHGEICRAAAAEIERLRAEVADAYSKSADVLAKLSANLCTASALDREKIIAERDEARRMVCEMEERLGCDESGCPKNGLAHDHAKRRGWDCFKEGT
jgi:hypothetical protein